MASNGLIFSHFVSATSGAARVLAVYAAYLSSQEPAFSDLLKRYTAEYRHIRPHIGGKALIAAGLAPSVDFTTILKKLRDARLDGEIRTDAEEEAYFQALMKAR